MPKEIKPADRASYVLCPTCSEEQGEEIFYPRVAITEREPGLFAKEKTRHCPRGHKIEEPAGGS